MENPEKNIQNAEHPALFDMAPFESIDQIAVITEGSPAMTSDAQMPATPATYSAAPKIEVESRTRLTGSEDREWEQHLMEDAEDRKNNWHA